MNMDIPMSTLSGSTDSHECAGISCVSSLLVRVLVSRQYGMTAIILKVVLLPESDAPFNCAGGMANAANFNYSTVVGGGYNVAGRAYAVVAGGYNNSATGEDAAIVGGASNTAGGTASICLGGDNNTASGKRSLAAGYAPLHPVHPPPCCIFGSSLVAPV